jgi:hypothetical protein
MECCRRSPKALKLLRKDQDLYETFIEYERLRNSPCVLISSDGSEWIVAKLDLRWPPHLVALVVEKMLTDLRRSIGLLMEHRDDGTTLESVARVLAAPDRWKRPSVDFPYPQRLHVDDLLLRLKVWDHFRQGGTFPEVAKLVGCPVSTVRDLYWKVAADILELEPPAVDLDEFAAEIFLGKRKARTPDRKARLIAFDPATHKETCPQCRDAKRESDFCSAALAYLNQDKGSMREPLKSSETLERIAADESRTKRKGRRVKPRGASPKA